MMKCTLILLLINTYNCGWGSPLTSSPSNGKPETLTAKLAENLNVLANKCNDKFISSEIKSKSADCIAQPQHFKCLIFYDINSRLCNSSSLNLLVKKEDYNVQMTTLLDLNQFCANASSWPVFDLKVYPNYSTKLKKIFSNPDYCKRLCESPQDIFNNDVDFYCKYYKWGMDILSKTQVDAKELQSVNEFTNPGSGLEIKSNNLTNTVSPRTNVEKPIKVQSTTAVSSSPHYTIVQQSGISSSDGVTDSATKPIDTGTNETYRLISSDNGNVVAPGNGTKVLETTTVSSATTQARFNNDIGESEEDPFLGPNLDNDMGPGELSEPGMKSSVPFQREPNHREIYTNMLQDSYKEDEDDHFFSLFLTGVIFVILLYVLYHNKNKVSKVVMGLIVEGRAGRRRNSRGHAYRRLDTLEQAVNAPHAVPPAKIIY